MTSRHKNNQKSKRKAEGQLDAYGKGDIPKDHVNNRGRRLLVRQENLRDVKFWAATTSRYYLDRLQLWKGESHLQSQAYVRLHAATKSCVEFGNTIISYGSAKATEFEDFVADTPLKELIRASRFWEKLTGTTLEDSAEGVGEEFSER